MCKIDLVMQANLMLRATNKGFTNVIVLLKFLILEIAANKSTMLIVFNLRQEMIIRGLNKL